MTGNDASGADDAQQRPGGDGDTVAGPPPLFPEEPPPVDQPSLPDEPPRFDDTAARPEAAAPDDTAPRPEAAAPDDTAPVEAAPGETPPPIGPTGTAVLPPVPGEPEPPGPRWAGRATVAPPPREETYGEPVYEEPRSAVLPVLVTVCVMLLIGVFALGAWLLLNNRRGAAPSPTESATTAPTTTTPAPATAATTVAPSGVGIPAVTGLDYDAAASILSSLGLVPERRDEFDDRAEAGQVLRTEPPEGTTVQPGSTVVVVVSRGPAPTTAAPTSAAPTES